MNTMVYDATGNLKDAGGGWTFTYDATGQQATSAVGNVQMVYDGERLRGRKSENGVVTYYLRSSVLGGQVVAEVTSAGTWSRGYVYLGGLLLAVQQAGNKINERRNELAKRSSDLTKNERDLPATGPFSVATHQEQFENRQRQLRKTINDFNTKGCGGWLPSDAWDYATMPTPSPSSRIRRFPE